MATSKFPAAGTANHPLVGELGRLSLRRSSKLNDQTQPQQALYQRDPALDAIVQTAFAKAAADHQGQLNVMKAYDILGTDHRRDVEKFAAQNQSGRQWLFHGTNVNCGLNALDGKDGPRKPCSGADRGHRNCGLCSNVVQRHRLTGGDLPADYTDDLKWAMYYATKACQTSGGYPVIMITHVAPGKAQEMDDVVNYKRSPGMHAVYRPKSREWMLYHPESLSPEVAVVFQIVDIGYKAPVGTQAINIPGRR